MNHIVALVLAAGTGVLAFDVATPELARGEACPRQEALREYEDVNSERRANMDPVLWRFWAPDPGRLYRWWAQLDSGCLEEPLT